MDASLRSSCAAEKDLELQNLPLLTSVEKSNNEVKRLSAEIETMRKAHQQEKDELMQQQDAKLKSIDEKIRKMLEAKDVEVHALRKAAVLDKQRLQEAEEVLSRLNSEFVPVKKR